MRYSVELQEAIKNNKLVLFIGAGLSKKFNLPDWKTFAIDIIREVNNEAYNTLIPAIEANILPPNQALDLLKSEKLTIHRYIKNNFKIENQDLSFHKKLLSLSEYIVTTNYDDAFEKACSNKITPTNNTSTFNLSEINKTNSPYIFKLHGSYTESDHCVVFTDDYQKIYKSNSAATEKLKSIFLDKTILFIGYSFSDHDLSIMFDFLDELFNNYNTHFILTTESDKFASYKFLKPIPLNSYAELDASIEALLSIKLNIPKDAILNNNSISITREKKKFALLTPKPLDIDFKEDLTEITECFENLNIDIYIGALNLKTIELLDDFDLAFIISPVFKSNIYIEDDNLKSNLLSPDEIISSIPNDNLPLVIITNESIECKRPNSIVHIFTFKRSILRKFVYKALRENNIDFSEPEIKTNIKNFSFGEIPKGTLSIYSIYGNNRNLEIGKKCLTSVIGRIEEQSSISLKLINSIKTNKVINIKASGGLGKTTIIKKVAYELYNRGYYKSGVSFKSCESVKTYADFEELIIEGFSLTNIINFYDYLKENFSSQKMDLLIIIDNFETVVNNLNKLEFEKVINLLKHSSDFANIVVTSRERITDTYDIEDVYSLTNMLTDDAYILFEKYYGPVKSHEEIRILRHEILEDLLNNNPLAIKLVTKSRIRPKHISELRDQIKNHFFESINEDYTSVFRNNADLNIERTKSIYQSINYSYTTLNNKEKIAFELLSLFPDGISLTNFKKCFESRNSQNNISDKNLRVLRDKSLVEDYNGTLQLQPIIRRFADFQFTKRQKDVIRKYCTDAYVFNCHILRIIVYISKSKSISEALRIYNLYKNNLMLILSYIREINISEKGPVPEKKYLLNFIYDFEIYVVNEKQIDIFHEKLKNIQDYFSDIPNAEKLIKVLDYNKIYYHKEFENSFKEINKLYTVEQMESRDINSEDYIETRYKAIIGNIYSMEGYTLQRIKSYVINNDFSIYHDAHFFYLGITNNISRKKDGFYYFEYELMFKRLDVQKLEDYINNLYNEEHLEIMQSTYTLSKIKTINQQTLKKLVVTNPYTKGLKELMFASIESDSIKKKQYYENALKNLSHIKYYYLEALYYYCLFLKEFDNAAYTENVTKGLNLSNSYYYQYINFLFSNIEKKEKSEYYFTYDYYPIHGLEEYVKQHNEKWERIFTETKYEI